jgi:2-keto-4-pentenoate hydratase
MTPTDISPLSQRLADARTRHLTLSSVPPELIPADADAAYAIQHEILRASGARIGGWKIGAKSDTGPIQGAPLPAGDVYGDGANSPTMSAPLFCRSASCASLSIFGHAA